MSRSKKSGAKRPGPKCRGETSRFKISGAKRPGPKSPGAKRSCLKHPVPECPGAKRPGPKSPEAKRPDPKFGGETSLLRNAQVQNYSAKRPECETSLSKMPGA